MLSKKWIWTVLIILAITWGSSFILIKKGLVAFTPYQIGSYRVFLASIIITLIGFKYLKGISKKDWFWIITAGLQGSFFQCIYFRWQRFG